MDQIFSTETIQVLVQLTGWLGTLLFIIAYIQLNRGVWTVKTVRYHVLNILGSVFLVVNTINDSSYAASMANLFWGLIAVYGLIKFRTSGKSKAPERAEVVEQV